MPKNNIKLRLLALPRVYKNILSSLADVIILTSSLFFLILINPFFKTNIFLENNLFLIPLLSIPIFSYFKIYRSILRFISIESVFLLFKSSVIYGLFSAIYFLIAIGSFNLYAFTFLISHWFISLISITAIRITAVKYFSTDDHQSKVLIYGAGAAGSQLSAALTFSPEFRPVCFVDEDKSLQGNFVNGLKVYDDVMIPKLIKKMQINELLIAIPSAPRSVINNILSRVEGLPVKVRTLPGIAELAQGKVTLSKLKEVKIEDILGRETVQPNLDLLEKNIKSKNVLITGAGGSIGSELARQIVNIGPKSLTLLEASEFALYEIDRELNDMDCDLNIILASIGNKNKLDSVIQQYKIDTIYHAAAYKHVGLVQNNPFEAVENNIFGTLNVAQSAISNRVATFVLISTDKAVRPTNIMGATKRIAEQILQSLSNESEETIKKTRFSIVRFGNVLGSSGSAIPLFREQIKNGGPITVTDPQVIRYFMTIQEASQLVLQASGMSSGGEIFLLDMGEPVRILDLAERMINLSGMEVKSNSNPEGDIEIIFTGLKPGEKLYEELLIEDKSIQTQHKQIFKSVERSFEWQDIKRLLGEIKIASEKQDLINLNQIFTRSVEGYKENIN